MGRKKAKAFEDMTPNEKRVAIARDLIEHVNAGRVRAQESVWLSSRGAVQFSNSDERQLDAVLKAVPTCTCCQLGGLLYATACRANAVKVSDVTNEYDDDDSLDYSGFSGYLERYFEEQQLMLMEMAFEGGDGAFSGYDLDTNEETEDELEHAANAFYFRHDNDEERMVAICQNIIDHGGEFVLPVPAPV
jgi:hypothetical protein